VFGSVTMHVFPIVYSALHVIFGGCHQYSWALWMHKHCGRRDYLCNLQMGDEIDEAVGNITHPFMVGIELKAEHANLLAIILLHQLVVSVAFMSALYTCADVALCMVPISSWGSISILSRSQSIHCW
jgi:hypothetical protein